MEKTKNRSIKMTDHQFNVVRESARERNLPIGKFLETACSEYGANVCEPDPNLVCRLLAIKNLLGIPREEWNEKMVEIYVRNVEEICVLLKW